ncbi:MAG: NADH-quinone oxidoreductase subunit M [Actinomycetota bacterium]
MDFPWLTLVIFLPLLGVPVLLVAKGIDDRSARGIGVAVTVLTLLASIGMLVQFDTVAAGNQLVDRAVWVESLGLQYFVGVDGISVWLVMLTTFMMPVAIFLSGGITKQVRLYIAASLVLETAVLGAFLSLDLLLFFVFFEALLVPMFLLIGVWGSTRRIYAAVKFFLYTMAGSAFLLVGIFVLYVLSGDELGRATFDLTQLQQLDLPPGTARWLFVAFFVAFAVKAPLFPVHTWLPDAHTEAPTKGSVVLAALLLKTGTYGMIRFNLTLFPEASSYFADVIAVLAVIGIIYGAIVAAMQTDLKRLIAYSSVSHIGFVVLGIFALTEQGMSGSVLQMVNHGLSTGLLFICVGLLYDRTHTREMSEMGGLATTMPLLAAMFLLATLSSIGLPGLNNFVGEFLVILGTFSVHEVLGAFAALGVILGAIYMLWAYQRTWQGAEKPAWAHLPDIGRWEAAAMGLVVVVMIAIGVYPKLLLDRVNPATDRVVARVVCADATTFGTDGSQVLAAPPEAEAPAVEGGEDPGRANCDEAFAPGQTTEEGTP